MDVNQIIVKTVLIVLLVVIAIMVVVPGRGARGQALQRLALLLSCVAGAIAVAFPWLTQQLADFLGIGRGVDLVLYGALVLGIGFAAGTSARVRRNERMITLLARRVALAEAGVVASAGDPAAGGGRNGEEEPR